MVKISTVIQIILAEKFVLQDFTIRATPGLSGPTNTCVSFNYGFSMVYTGVILPLNLD